MTPEPALRPAGWYQQDGTWYYADGKGSNVTDKWIKSSGKWYHLGADGAMRTGWAKQGGDWYYLSSSGAMKTGWLKLGSSWYYLKPSGAMVTGQYTIDGCLNRFASNGVWQGYVAAGSGGGSSVAAPVCKNCKDVWDKLGRPIYPSDPGWQQEFDADKDGVGCEVRPR